MTSSDASEESHLSAALLTGPGQIAGWVMLGLLAVAAALSRYLYPSLPVDFSAYRAAAETFALGQDPYGPALFKAASYQGFVYIYPPGTLPFLRPLLWLSPGAMAGLDVILHAVAILVSLAWVRHNLSLRVPLLLPALLVVMWWPFTYDLSVGNLASYMLLAFLACVWMSQNAPARRWQFLLALVCGVALAFKPMWGMVAGIVLLWRRRWTMALALLSGALIVVALSLVPWGGEVLLDSWWGRLGAIRAQVQAVTMLELCAPLLPVVALLWLGAGWALVRRLGHQHPQLWLWGCVSLIAWPRLSSYSFMMLIPVVAFFWRRWGWQKALVAALPAFGPIPWLFKSLDAVYAYHAVLYGWAWAVAIVLFVELWRRPERSTEPVLNSRG